MRIISNQFSGNRGTLQVEATIERGWFQQYPEYSIVAVDIELKSRIGEAVYSRPEIPFLNFGPSIQMVQGTVQYTSDSGRSLAVYFYTRDNLSSPWVLRYSKAFKAGDQMIVEESEKTDWVKPALFIGGAAVTGYLLTALAKIFRG